MFLCLCVDPVGAARSNPVTRRSDSAAAGPAGSASADHHPAAPDRHHSWTEPSTKKIPHLHIANLCILRHQITIKLCKLILFPSNQGAADQRAGPTSGADS